MGQDHFLNLQPGTIINGRYEIVKCLGTGSMGMVYACRHRELAGHLVAMKVLFAEVARDSVAAARFRNEIVASYGVSHPNVVRAYEYFRDGDLIAFTMEYIGGGDLADRINGDDQLTIDEIVRMVSQMCSGVQAIHDAGIIHRDLKPENILLTATGDIKITDFGIARTGTGPKLTEHGGVVGTIDYVSPEYLERGQVDARSDIYALGVLAYEMVTGESPFRGQSVIETMTMRLRSDAVPPHQLRPDCPPPLSEIILKAMARDPEKRYQSAAEMLYDLTSLSSTSLPSFYLTQSQHKTDTSQFLNGDAKVESGARPAVVTSNSSGSYPNVARPAGSGYSSGSNPSIAAALASPASPAKKPVEKAPPPVSKPAEEQDDFYLPAQLESVLQSRNAMKEQSKDSYDSSPSVSISSGRLQAQRIRQLSSELQPLEQESIFKKLVSWIIFIFVGFGVGILILTWLKPEFFGEARVARPTSYIEQK